MKCPNCNNTIPIGAKFCINCGEDIPENYFLIKKDLEKVAKIDLQYRGVWFSDVASKWQWALGEVSEDINLQLNPWIESGWKIKNNFLTINNLVVDHGTNWGGVAIDIAISSIFRTQSSADHSRVHVLGAEIPMIRNNTEESDDKFYSNKDWYGIICYQNDDDIKKTYSIYFEGFFTYIVIPQSPAGKAGLKFGDVVYQIEGKDIKTYLDFDEALMNASVNKGAEFCFIRKGVNYKANVIPDFPPWL